MLCALAHVAQLGVGEQAGVVAVGPDRRQCVSADPANLVHVGLALVEGGVQADDAGKVALARAERARACAAQRQP